MWKEPSIFGRSPCSDRNARFTAEILNAHVLKLPRETSVVGIRFYDCRWPFPAFAIAYDLIYPFLTARGATAYDPTAGNTSTPTTQFCSTPARRKRRSNTSLASAVTVALVPTASTVMSRVGPPSGPSSPFPEYQSVRSCDHV
jgi:hypothetical protein